ncbi:MAG TPA: FG-GAP-like repeat-containing protein, partial [Gaiellaceae bacterium]|nr:FG-GAP-like repeat-containing protein [Gaiellaceae bacterium]
MSAPALAGRPSLTIRGTQYPILLPTVRDPRLHLAAVIITLQVLGQTAFDFNLSIAQILVALGTCAVLEVGIAFFRHHVLMWPASALLTGNGVAFVLRVPGTQHGDWWSMHGWWIFAGTAAVALLSKHVIRFRGRHLFNPSNFGLVLCFLLLGRARAEPLDFWWGPMSVWLALALALIVVGGLAILSRLRLLFIAVGFWIAFAAGIAVLAASGHSMTARWHLGPISGWSFWWLLVTSPEILVFLFFMITDPKTIPNGRVARLVYAVGVGLLATLLIAPQTTEYATKVAVLTALALVCAARPLLERLLPEAGSSQDRPSVWGRGLARRGRVATGGLALAGAAAFAGLVVLAGIPARTPTATAGELLGSARLPEVTVVAANRVSSKVDRATAQRIARDIVLDLQAESDALRLRDFRRATVAATGAWLETLHDRIRSSTGKPVVVSTYEVDRVRLALTPGEGQGPPRILATLVGSERRDLYSGLPPKLVSQAAAVPFKRSLEVVSQQGRYVIVGSGAGTGVPANASAPAAEATPVHATGALAGVRLQDVASRVGLAFRQGALRFGVSNDLPAMMGGGLCWLDYDGDGWMDLYVVNSYSNADRRRWATHGGLPRSALFHNVGGEFVDVSRRSGADLAVRGQGCVAADFDGDGHTDLFVTTDSSDRMLWNNGDGTFSEGAEAAGITSFGWHTGAAVADVNGDGRPDLFVAGYTDLNAPDPTAITGFPSNYAGVRDLLYLNQGLDEHGHATFREVGVQAGLEAARFGHGLGAVFTDVDGDGRQDLYVANDEDPNQFYENVAWPGGAAADPAGLGFRLEERGRAEGVDDPYAGMGIASGDYDGDGRFDLFVTNSRHEPHAVLHRRAGDRAPSFASARRAFRSGFGASSTGWGAAWADLALDGTPDLVLTNGLVPITNLAKDAGRIQVLENVSTRTRERFAYVGHLDARGRTPVVNGRGLAAADYDNDGRMDIAIASVGGPLVLLRNTGGRGHWLEVALPSFSPGAVVRATLPGGRTLVREVHAGSSYLSSEDPRVHFGLGPASRVRSLVVIFPDGREKRLRDVAVDRVVVVKAPTAVLPATSTDEADAPVRVGCTPARSAGRSVARVWDDAALALDPGGAPAEQARNLFHLSAAMWDAWSAYDDTADGYFVTEKHSAIDVQAAREGAISSAAYRLLTWRASFGTDMRRAFARLTATMRSLCYEPGFVDMSGDSPAALGNRIAAAAITYGRTDGSLELRHYVDPSYTPVNEPLVLAQPGATMHDRTFWQPLALDEIVVQGGLPIPADAQTFLDSQWGRVRSFALPVSRRLPLDPGAPALGGPSATAYQQAAVAVIRASARADGDAVAERWRATGPRRWNEIANAVADSRARARRIGTGAAQGLASDVRLYFALNGALHDTAIATWGAKRTYQSVRPISMIRSLAFQGQSSDPKAPSYSPEGLPLVPGLVEVVTRESSAAGERHAALAGHVGDIAVRTARGWVLGTEWLPRGGLVTPPSPGWVSDGSAFARAAAAVLAADTGRRTFPTRMGLPWTTYRSAADEAGLAGVFAGTQTAADDIAGRRVGAAAGARAWTRAQRFF